MPRRSVEESNRWLLRARDAMDRTYAQPLDVRTLAQIAHVSEAQFIRTFRATFGETPHRYLQRRRVERAMFLLARDRHQRERDLPRRGLSQPRQLQPHLQRDRGRVAHRLPGARRAQGGPHVLHDELDATEQFWRSAPSGAGLGSAP